MTIHDQLTELWAGEFVRKNLCGLCGNTGFIDTRFSAFSPAGIGCGDRFHCICPNGRSIAGASKTELSRAILAPGWQPMEKAPRFETLLGVVDGKVRLIAWTKTSHVPIYDWCLMDQGAEDCDTCKPTGWQRLPSIDAPVPSENMPAPVADRCAQCGGSRAEHAARDHYELTGCGVFAVAGDDTSAPSDLRTEMERIADLTERWTDSLVSQVNQIAREALGRPPVPSHPSLLAASGARTDAKEAVSVSGSAYATAISETDDVAFLRSEVLRQQRLRQTAERHASASATLAFNHSERVTIAEAKLAAILEWYDGDGSVGGCANLIEDIRPLVPSQTMPVSGEKL